MANCEKHPVGGIIWKMVQVVDPGSPVYSPSLPSELEIIRNDNTLKGPEIYRSIYEQGLLFGGCERIDINDTTELLVLNSTVASPHTVFKVPYAEFEYCYRDILAHQGTELPHGVLVAGKDSTSDEIVPPKSVALDMLTWILRRDKNTGLIMPTDIGDFSSLPCGNPDIDQHRMQLSDEKLQELYSAVVKRGKIATQTLQCLYDKVIRREFPFLPEKANEDFMQGVLIGYYRGDDAKGLQQWLYDHRGKGPMSNPSTHFRYTCHLDMKILNQLDLRNPTGSFYDLVDLFKAKPEYFGNDITFAQMKAYPGHETEQKNVIKRLFERYTPEEILKVIDPLSSVFHDHLETWIADGLRNELAYLTPASVQGFADHTSEYERELRVSEGTEIIFNTNGSSQKSKDQILVESLARITQYVGEVLTPLWDEVNNFVIKKVLMSKQEQHEYLDHLGQRYELPQEVLKQIPQLMPTERQLKNLLQTDLRTDQRTRVAEKLDKYERYKDSIQEKKIAIMNKINNSEGTVDDLSDLVLLTQQGQIFDDEKMNSGYNIPGVPGMCIIYHSDTQERLHVKLGWLLSQKGLAETWFGGMIKRVERNI